MKPETADERPAVPISTAAESDARAGSADERTRRFKEHLDELAARTAAPVTKEHLDELAARTAPPATETDEAQ